jgi:hypothetical protein
MSESNSNSNSKLNPNILAKINNNTYETPLTTNNPLCDVIKWLNNGNTVLLYNKYGQWRIYHNNCEKTKNFDNTICCVNCQTVPGILDDGEWDYYIEEDGSNKKCECENNLKTIKELISYKSKNVFMFDV